METKFLRDALFSGMTANAFKLGTVLSLGWFWMRPNGCRLLYRGESIERMDLCNVLSVTQSDADKVSPPVYHLHEAGFSYFYVISSVNRCGKEGLSFNAMVKLSVDAAGELSRGRPNNNFCVEAERFGGDKVRLHWYYCPLLQGAEPSVFKVYYDAGTGQIDLENPLATIAYEGRKFYSFQSGSLAPTRYLFLVLIEDDEGAENGAFVPLEIEVDDEGVAAVKVLKVDNS